MTAAVVAIAFSPATIPAPVTIQSAFYVVAGLGVVLVANPCSCVRRCARCSA
jgi:hypothetical protein